MGKSASRQPSEPELPGNLGWLPWIGHYVAREWPVIRAAPLSMAFVAAVAALVAITATVLFYSERISTFEARDKYLAGQLGDYKQAFPGKSPDQAAKELADLRGNLDETTKRLSALEGRLSQGESERHLKDEEKRIMIDGIRSLPEERKLPIFTVASTIEYESSAYAKEFIEFFKDNNINITHRYADSPENTYELPYSISSAGKCVDGFVISVKYPKNPPQSGKDFYAIMWSANIWPKFEKFYGNMPSEFMASFCQVGK